MPKDNLNSLRHIEGFSLGEDDDLFTLSDPPHYTAYPNLHLADFIQKWGQPYDKATSDYHCEPYVANLSKGKNDPIYNAHSYHTKVPYKAIIPFIKRYTEPGEIVFDGFCGTGMTSVVAQMTGRQAILCDLSPAATFIAYNYNTPVDTTAISGKLNVFCRKSRLSMADCMKPNTSMGESDASTIPSGVTCLPAPTVVERLFFAMWPWTRGRFVTSFPALALGVGQTRPRAAPKCSEPEKKMAPIGTSGCVIFPSDWRHRE